MTQRATPAQRDLRNGQLVAHADRMGLTQPAISIALGRLRRHFDDALFVRVGNTMQATPQTEGMIEGVRAAIAAVESTLTYRQAFEPARAERKFRLAMTDIGQIVLLPQMLDALALNAPGAQVEVSNISEQTPQLLTSGELDVALGFIPELSAGFFIQTLFEEQFACLVKVNHPRIKESLTLRQFKSESHVVVTTSGTGHFIVERTLDEMKITRRIAGARAQPSGPRDHRRPHGPYLHAAKRAATALAASGAVSAFPVPFKLPTYAVKLHWHKRQHHDPGNRWLRSFLSTLFQRRI